MVGGVLNRIKFLILNSFCLYRKIENLFHNFYIFFRVCNLSSPKKYSLRVLNLWFDVTLKLKLCKISCGLKIYYLGVLCTALMLMVFSLYQQVIIVLTVGSIHTKPIHYTCFWRKSWLFSPISIHRFLYRIISTSKQKDPSFLSGSFKRKPKLLSCQSETSNYILLSNTSKYLKYMKILVLSAK